MTLRARVEKLENNAEAAAFWRREITAARDAVHAARTDLPEEAAEIDGQTAGEAMAPVVGALREEIRKLRAPKSRDDGWDVVEAQRRELNVVRDERNQAVADCDALRAERDELRTEQREYPRNQVEEARAERNAFALERDTYRAQRDEAIEERDRLFQERDELHAAMQDLRAVLPNVPEPEVPGLSSALLRALFVCSQKPSLFHPDRTTEAGEGLLRTLHGHELIGIDKKSKLPFVTALGQKTLRDQS